MSDLHRVVILGGGFGGLYAARSLARAQARITLIDRRNFHLFQPLLYQVATGSLSPGEIAAPLRGVLSRQSNTAVLLGEAVDLDPVHHTVALADGAVFGYDSLIVATGSAPTYFGHDEWTEIAPGLKTVEDATRIRHKILYAFEAAERMTDADERRAWLTFVIVGGGATGVELAGALAEIARHTLRHDFRSIRPEEARILLLDGSPRLLTNYPPELSSKAERSLTRMGVRVRLDVRVTAIDENGLDFAGPEGDEHLKSHTIIWAGGVVAAPFTRTLAARTGATTDKLGRIHVNGDLSIPGHPEIYVAGDHALVLNSAGKPLPGVAQVAMQQGAYAARHIMARLAGRPVPPSFRYHDRGDMAVIGRAAAVANIFGLHVWGWPAWLIWLFIHLMYLVQYSSRIRVFIQWGIQYFTFNRGARLITGSELAPPRAPDYTDR